MLELLFVYTGFFSILKKGVAFGLKLMVEQYAVCMYIEDVFSKCFC